MYAEPFRLVHGAAAGTGTHVRSFQAHLVTGFAKGTISNKH